MSLLVIVVLVATFVAVSYRRQIVSYLTHRKGGPTSTVPYVPFDTKPLLHIAVAGDTGDAGRHLDRTGAVTAQLDEVMPFDVLLLLGDLVYPSGDPARLQALVFDPFAPVLDGGADLLAVLGNHDVKRGRGDDIVAALGQPGRYWARTYGDVLIVGIDTNRLTDPEQLAFVEETLAASSAQWTIVAMHHPPYSAGYQGSNMTARSTFSPLFARYGVDLVLSGHDHDYQRSNVIDGVTYVVSGAGSGTRRTGEDDFTAVSWSFEHITEIGVFADRIVLRAVGTDGRVADEATISEQAGP